MRVPDADVMQPRPAPVGEGEVVDIALAVHPGRVRDAVGVLDVLGDAKAEVDRQQWRAPGDVANAFEITDESGNALTWRAFRTWGRTSATDRLSGASSAQPTT